MYSGFFAGFNVEVRNNTIIFNNFLAALLITIGMGAFTFVVLITIRPFCIGIRRLSRSNHKKSF